MKRTALYCLALAVLGALLAAWYWPSLPDPMPTHWGDDGMPDDFMPKWIAVSILPLAALVAPAILLVAARLDPRQAHVQRSEIALSIIAITTSALFLVVQFLAIQASMTPGHFLDVRVGVAAVAMLWIVLGNIMPKLRSNYFAGIRTPWTLESEKVWHLTHRVAGWSFAAGGFLALFFAFILPMQSNTIPILGALIGAGIVPMVYSWFAYRKHHPDGVSEPAEGEGK